MDIRDFINASKQPISEIGSQPTPSTAPPYNHTDHASYRAYNEDTDKLRRLIRSESAVPCFGGYLFRREKPGIGHVICFAVQKMTPDAVRAAEESYAFFGRMGHLGMLPRTPCAPIVVDDYTVFEFIAFPNDKSIRSILQDSQLPRISHDKLMSDLVNLIRDYKKTLRDLGHNEYYPLSCLSKDTVLIDNNLRVKVLPLRANWSYPIEIPHEVVIGEYSDERSDLFSAAYLAVEIFSKKRGSSTLIEPDYDIICGCLKSIHDWRPTLEDVCTGIATPHHMDDKRIIHNKSSSFKDNFQKAQNSVKAFFKDLPGFFELEESESSFQCTETMFCDDSDPNRPIEVGPSNPDSTFRSTGK